MPSTFSFLVGRFAAEFDNVELVLDLQFIGRVRAHGTGPEQDSQQGGEEADRARGSAMRGSCAGRQWPSIADARAPLEGIGFRPAMFS
jgi:hypothetical protein